MARQKVVKQEKNKAVKKYKVKPFSFIINEKEYKQGEIIELPKEEANLFVELNILEEIEENKDEV